MANRVLCPKCGENNEPKALKCRSCGYEIVPPQLKFLLEIPDVDASIVQKIYIAGYKNVEDLKNAKVKDLTKIEGISKIIAGRIKQHILKLILKHEFVDTDQKVSLYICSNCGALLGPTSTQCAHCGAILISSEETTVPTETERKKEEEERTVRELEKPKITLFLCSNCGAFVSSDAKACPKCGALMEGEAQEGEIAEGTEGYAESGIGLQETYGAILGICRSCGAFLSRNSVTCPVCGSSTEGSISVAISSGLEEESETDTTTYSFDPKLETQGKIFLCEVCGAFVSEGAETCPICNSPTANRKREVIRIGEKEEISTEDVIKLLEKEIINAMETADGGKKVEGKEVMEALVESSVEPEIVEFSEFEVIEKELKDTLPEHQIEETAEATELVSHLEDVHSAVTSEIGDILAESVVKERFTFEDQTSEEVVKHSPDPVADVESELWEYFLDEEEEVPAKENECPICGYKNPTDAEKCEICSSIIRAEEEKNGSKEKEQTQPETKLFKEVKKEVQTLPLSRIEMKPVFFERKSYHESMFEKNYHLLLAFSLAGIGVGCILLFGLTLLALGAVSLGFVIIGVLFSLLLRKRQRDEKFAVLEEASKPSEIAIFNMGSTYLATGRFAEAARAFEEVVKINPRNEVAWNNLGSALSRLERYEEALKCYEKALEIKPDFEIVWNNKGNALARLGRFEEALKCYDKAIALKKDYHDAWVNKGYVLVKMGRYSEAIACANEANKLMEKSYG